MQLSRILGEPKSKSATSRISHSRDSVLPDPSGTLALPRGTVKSAEEYRAVNRNPRLVVDALV
jgi:hypothetical protein